MRYLAICILSLTALLRAAGTSAGAEEVVRPAPSAAVLLEPLPLADGYDAPLTIMLSAALIVLQLRRRQKSLRMPRGILG